MTIKILRFDKILKFDHGLAELSSASQRFVKNHPARRLLVAIAGGSASGKSFMAHHLRAELLRHGVPATVVALDNYFRDRDDPDLPRTPSGHICFDAPSSYFEEEFRNDVIALLRGETRCGPQYKKDSMSRLKERIRLLPEKIIIAEGLFAVSFLGRIPRLVTTSSLIKVYMEASEPMRQSRRVKKAVEHYGVAEKKAETVFKNIVLPYHKRYIAPQRDIADVIINTG